MKQLPLKISFSNGGGTMHTSLGDVHFLDPNKPAESQKYKAGVRYTADGQPYDKDTGEYPDVYDRSYADCGCMFGCSKCGWGN